MSALPITRYLFIRLTPGNHIPLPADSDSSAARILVEHDLFRKPVSTFRDHALNGRNHAPIDFGNAGDAGQRHADIELVADDLDGAGDTGLTAGAEAVDVGATAHAGARAERDGAHHVLPRADTAVEHDLNFGAERVGDRRQHGDRGCRTVELAAAVIGDHDRRRAGLGRDARSLDVEDAFEDELAGPQTLDPLDILPAQRRIELLDSPLRQHCHAFHAADVAGDV